MACQAACGSSRDHSVSRGQGGDTAPLHPPQHPEKFFSDVKHRFLGLDAEKNVRMSQ